MNLSFKFPLDFNTFYFTHAHTHTHTPSHTHTISSLQTTLLYKPLFFTNHSSLQTTPLFTFHHYMLVHTNHTLCSRLFHTTPHYTTLHHYTLFYSIPIHTSLHHYTSQQHTPLYIPIQSILFHSILHSTTPSKPLHNAFQTTPLYTLLYTPKHFTLHTTL